MSVGGVHCMLVGVMWMCLWVCRGVCVGVGVVRMLCTCGCGCL